MDYQGACFHSWSILCGSFKGQIGKQYQGYLG